MNLTLDTLNTQLSQQGYKLTRQRKAVVEVVTQTHTRLSAAEVFTQSPTRVPRSGPDDGLSHAGDSGADGRHPASASGGRLRRLCAATAEHGHHVICSRCQDTIEFEGAI